MPEPKPMPVTLLTWKPLNKGSLWGFADVQLGAMKINGVMVFHKDDGQSWAMLPSKPSIKADGTVYTGSDGKPKYTPVVEWANRETSERFSAAVIAAIRGREEE